MTEGAQTLVGAGGLALSVALALAAALSWQAARATRERRLRDEVEHSQRLLRELQRRHAAGEISADELEAGQRQAAQALLADGPPATPPPAIARRPRVLAVLALACALAAGAGYAWLGAGQRLPAQAHPATTAATPASGAADHAARALTDEQLERMVAQTRQRVDKAPQDAAAWAMLAHSYDMLGKFAESSKAYGQLARLMPKDAQVLADYADALAVANGRRLAGEPAALVRKALAIDPHNVKALALAGTAAFEAQDYDQAIARWQAARDAARDPQFIAQIDASLAAARASVNGQPASAPVPPTAASRPGLAAASAVVSGRLTLADDLQAKAPPDATVFIFARPVNGSRMPVAILRRHVRDLPLEFSLDDSMAMVADARLSSASTVIIGARISRRGDVAPEAGDMQGLTAPVAVGTRGVKLEISEVLR